MSGGFHLVERLASFGFAFRGLRSLLVEEHNARIHLFASVAVITFGVAVGLDANDWRWVILAIALVWLAEAFNTAVERLGDAVTLERNPQIGIAKDVAAAGVLIASIAAALIGTSIFGPYLLDWIRG